MQIINVVNYRKMKTNSNIVTKLLLTILSIKIINFVGILTFNLVAVAFSKLGRMVEIMQNKFYIDLGFLWLNDVPIMIVTVCFVNQLQKMKTK